MAIRGINTEKEDRRRMRRRQEEQKAGVEQFELEKGEEVPRHDWNSS